MPANGLTPDQIRFIQNMLNEQLGTKIPVTGEWNDDTEGTVRHYQRIHNLTIDGIVGPKTAYVMALPWSTNPQRAGQTAPGATPGGDAWLAEVQNSNAYAWMKPFLEIPELRGLVQRAVQDGWTSEKFQQELRGTEYWRSKNQTMRTWDTLGQADKDRLKQQAIGTVKDMVFQIYGGEYVRKQGWDNFNDPRWFFVNEWAHKLATGIATQEEIKYALIKDAMSHPETVYFIEEQDRQAELARKKKTPEQIAEDLFREARQEYWVPISKEAARNYANQIMQGTFSYGEFSDIMRATAKQRYPAFAKQIDSGVSPKSMFSPYTQLAAGELDMDEDALIMDDTLFAEIARGASSGQFPSMTDFLYTVRSTDAWKFSRKAQDQVASFGTKMLRQFGLVGGAQ